MKLHSGFTLIELLVTLSIFTLISGITVAKYPQFSGKMVLENVSHQVGLSLREAQTYGLGVREFSVGTSVFPAYGLHFSLASSGTTNDPADEKSYLLFADTAGSNNKKYDGLSACNTGGECVGINTIQSGDRIVALCGDLQARGGTLASPNGASCDLTSLDVTFTRPNPDAYVLGCKANGSCATYSDGSVFLYSPRGDYKMVIAWPTGQIAVKDGAVYVLPAVALSSSPSSVSYGGATTLSWSSTDATGCTGTGNWSGNKGTSGTEIRANLTGSETYTLTCTGPGGSASDTETVSVGSPSAPSVALSASPSTVNSGQTTTLSWTVSGTVTSCTASGGGWSGSKNTSGGSETSPSISSQTTFTLTCTGPGGSGNGSAIVSVNSGVPAPTISSFTATPSSLAAGGGQSTLSWTTSTADSVTCTASASPSNSSWNGSQQTGTRTKNINSITQTTTFTLTCTTAGGSVSQNVTVTVAATPPPTISSLTATPSTLPSGDDTQIKWTTSTAFGTTCNGTSVPSNSSWNGSRTPGTNKTKNINNLTQTTTFTLTCTNAGGSVSQSVTATIQ